jgi:GntR family transcriptional regulator, transcriptional repressor for pyruvate dehydrogenase complex
MHYWRILVPNLSDRLRKIVEDAYTPRVSSTETETTSAVATTIAALERLALDELQPGELLPSEAALADSLGVSRLTVREATRALQARGLVELRKGRRPVVLAPNGSLAGDFFRTAVRRDANALFELLEVRRALEVHIAFTAASRAPRAALVAMEHAIAEMRRRADDEEAFHEADVRFHEALAAATGNSMLTQLIEQLAEPLRVSRRHSFRGRLAAGGSAADVVDAHQAILDAVAERDPAAAAEAMRLHLRTTERDLHAALRPDPI